MAKIGLYPTQEQWKKRFLTLKNYCIKPGNQNGRIELTNPSKIILALLLVLIIVTVTYWPVFRAQALCFDDDQYFIHNHLINQLRFSSITRFFTEIKPTTVGGYYQPIMMVSLIGDFLFSRGQLDNLRLFHQTSLIIHLLNCICILLFLYLLFQNLWAASVIALLFGLHPLTVEPVAWIAERKTLLAALFSLITLICYLQAIVKRRKKYYICALGAFLLALMSKPTCIGLPLAMVFLDYWPLKRSSRKALVEKIPFLFLSLLFAGITYISQKITGGIVAPHQTIIFSGNHFFLGVPLALSYEFVFYLVKFIFPIGLTPHYPVPLPFVISNPLLSGSLLFTILLVILLATFRRLQPLLIGFSIFVLMLAPTSGVIGFTRWLTLDDYAYLPIIVGFLPPLAWLAEKCFTKIFNSVKHRWWVMVIVMFLAALTVTEIRITQNNIGHWKNTVGLFRYMTEMAPGEAEIYDMLGNALLAKGRTGEAIVNYRKALKTRPPIYDVRKFRIMFYNDLGMALGKNRDYKEAYLCIQKAIDLDPKYDKGYCNFGILYAQQKQYVQAIRFFEKAARLNPDNSMYYYSLAQIYYKKGDRYKGDWYYSKFKKISRLKGFTL